MPDIWSYTHALLTSTLQLAVPMWIEQLKGCSQGYILERARLCSQEIAEHGDLLLFVGEKKGSSAEVFNRLAEGIACLSFCSGGVKIFGDHWEAFLCADMPKDMKNVLLQLVSQIKDKLEEVQGLTKKKKLKKKSRMITTTTLTI